MTIIDHPKMNDDYHQTYADVLVTIDVLSNDNGDYDSSTTKKLTDTRNGNIDKKPDNTFTHTPNAGYVGFDTFTYDICNANISVSSSATVNMTIIAHPKTNDDYDETYVDVLVTIHILSNDNDDYT